MSYEVIISYYDDDYFVVDRVETLGIYSTMEIAEKTLKNSGLVKHEDMWIGPYKSGKIEKVYKGIKDD